MRIQAQPGCDSCGVTKQTTRAASFARQVSTNTELSLTTAEGDKVVLSLSRRSLDSAAAVVSGDGSTDYASLRTRASEVKIQVEGDLNAQELKDITSLARTVSRLAIELAEGGEGQQAVPAPKAGPRFGSIQNYLFSFRHQVSSVFTAAG